MHFCSNPLHQCLRQYLKGEILFWFDRIYQIQGTVLHQISNHLKVLQKQIAVDRSFHSLLVSWSVTKHFQSSLKCCMKIIVLCNHSKLLITRTHCHNSYHQAKQKKAMIDRNCIEKLSIFIRAVLSISF